MYRHIATQHCNFAIGAHGLSPGDGEFYALDCNIVCGESGGSFHPAPNAKDGYGQWIGASYGHWKAVALGMLKKLDRQFSVRLHFGSTAGANDPLEQHVIGWLSAGHDVWYGNKPMSACQ